MAITGVILHGFKCFRDRTLLDIRPLTILGGANSSGKSSAMQGLLLLKQTLEAPFDPGPLRLDGPIVRFSSARELVWGGDGAGSRALQVGLVTDRGASRGAVRWASEAHFSVELTVGEANLTLRGTSSGDAGGPPVLVSPDTPDEELIRRFWPEYWARPTVTPERFFYWIGFPDDPSTGGWAAPSIEEGPRQDLLEVLHLPGLRGNPERAYPLIRVPRRFEGSFGREYTAALLWDWHQRQDGRLDALSAQLGALGLTARVRMSRANDLAAEIQVARLSKVQDVQNFVNISDVGLGVSQVLPVLVALQAAQPGQLVYIEQPELHLHPRAQAELGRILAATAARGVRVVAETHSLVLLRSIQVQVARGALAPDDAVLHWFRLDDEGAAVVSSASPDASGAWGDWPEDLGDAALEMDERFMAAAWEALG